MDDSSSGFRPRYLCLRPPKLSARVNRYSHCMPARRRFNPFHGAAGTERAVEQHVTAIFSNLDLPPTAED